VRAYLQTFGALLARDIRVLRRNFGQFLIRTIMQPFLFVFVFAYVFPKIGQGFHSAVAGVAFSTVLVPGLIAVAINFQGIQAVALPLVQEFSVSREIEDRVLAPVPVWVVGFEKIFAGAMQSLIAAFTRNRVVDERDRLIELRGYRAGYLAFASLMVIGLGMLWFHSTMGHLHIDSRMMGLHFLSVFFGMLVIADITKTATQIVAYRRAL